MLGAAFLLVACQVLAAGNDYAQLQPGSMAEPWMSGGPNCLTVPQWQVHAYNEDFYILRESGCVSAEKPFLYLIFGDDKALLEDTGDASDGPDHVVVPTASVVMDVMARWARLKHHAPVSLVVIHSHSHHDHTAADSQFRQLAGVEVIAAAPRDIQTAAGLLNWPQDLGRIDLGHRVVDVIPIPGHDVASIALYDRRTGNLMTGDSLYPGRLYVPEEQIPTFAASAKRLADFVKTRPIAHVLGTHIEEGTQPYFDYPTGTSYQPREHVLELSRAHVFELDEAFRRMHGRPELIVYPEFSVVPRITGAPRPPALQAGNGLGLQPGEVPTGWRTGGPNCVAVPDWEVRAYNEDFYILRESGCVNPEKPFLYLIVGDKKALLEDTGVGPLMPDGSRGTAIPTAPIIMNLLAGWAAHQHHAPVALVVIHSHGHTDHTAADSQFRAAPEVQFIAATPREIQQGAGIGLWPTDIGQIDLGGRIIDVIPIPGHQQASIALYDRLTGNLLTGDSLYPGLLSVSQADLPDFTASAARLADFARTHPIAHVLGTHIEQALLPYRDYGGGIPYQPDEHGLELSRAHVFELNDAFIELHGKLKTVPMPDFTIVDEEPAATTSTPRSPN